ncbi:CBS domain-containing protein [Microlunatus flavus]|uniref:CBS domain-containing protein n=1 Tax=Microlunatus flavus TaxID=1036181 RepID=A0A1H9G994_9ACTN|nr:CBS domain-containing protein [Microlunatus flavus]SEQ46687.1 CBS domain-containing protein [Microlunatus flavus]
MQIREVLAHKGSDVVHAPPGATVAELVALLRAHDLGALVVSSDGRQVAGIVSERDVVRHLDEPDLLDRPVSAIMTSLVCSCTPTDSVESVMALMTERRVRHVPVLSPTGTLAGIVSIGDVVKSQLAELAFERDQLQTYVSG